MEVLKAGGRKLGVYKSTSSTPYGAFEQGGVGECRVNSRQMAAIEHLYYSSASIQAARTILHGQLLGSGLSVTRNGKAVKLTPSFQKHLEGTWTSFAREVVDATLMWGMVVVTIEEEPDPPFAAFRGIKRPRVGGASGQPGDPQSKRTVEAARAVTRAPGPSRRGGGDDGGTKSKNLVPSVPLIGTYEVALTPTGRAAYVRQSRVFTTSPAHAYVEDPYAHVFFRNKPDANGNVVSPIASCFEQAQFVNALRELALSAEVVRATPTLVTQSAPRINAPVNGGVDAASLFFDSESRAVQQQSASDEASDRAAQLALTARLAAELNRVRTTNVDPSSSQPTATAPSLPPEVPPRLFALPEKQVLVPNALQPQARTDLESLMRFANDAIACSLGVPASVIFEGRFSSNSMSQLQLLNNTVASIALFVNSVLTASYNAIYSSNEDDETELILSIAPISSTNEVQALYAGGIVDIETALPAALNSLGCSAEEIASAVDRRRKKDEEAKAMKDMEERVAKAELRQREEAARSTLEAPEPAASKTAAPSAPSAPSAPASERGDED